MLDQDRQVHEDVACTVCGCVCDDLRVTTFQGSLESWERACPLAEPWFQQLRQSPKPPEAKIGGQPASFPEALNRGVELLRQSRLPLIWGLSRSSTEGQRAAVTLAERIGAIIDTTASVCHGPSIMAIQQVGESTCSLGEAKNRADLVIFWGANPVESHPRHLERYSLHPIGEFLPNGRADRTLVVVDCKPTATSRIADQFVHVPEGADFEVLWSLRQLLRNEPFPPEFVSPIPINELEKLVQKMRSCQYGVIFFGLGVAQKGMGHANVEALLRLVADLNAHTRFSARRLRIPGDVAGADSVLCWQTGFPFAVNMTRGYPRYNPGEYSANELLESGEVDSCVLVGSERIGDLSATAQQRLTQIPTIVLDYPHVNPEFAPTVRFTTAVYGVHLPGTAYRMDEIPIPLRALIPSQYPSDAAILQALAKGV